MTGGAQAVTTREAAKEIVAVALWRRAFEDGVEITRRWCDEQLDRHCSEPCDLAHLTTGNKVHFTAALWDRQYRRSKLLARR